MLSSGIVAAFLIGPHVKADDLASQLPLPEAGILRIESRDQQQALRAVYRDMARRSFRTAKPDPFEMVPQLIGMYETLRTVRGFPVSERNRMRETLRARLRSMRDRLAYDLAKLRRKEGRAGSRVRTARTDADSSGPLSGTEQQNVAELIDLIESTVEPDSWASRGGNGTMTYYRRLRVLVVRQTSQVHHQIGQTLGQLKK